MSHKLLLLKKQGLHWDLLTDNLTELVMIAIFV